MAAKKGNDMQVVRCTECRFSIGQATNHLVGCSNPHANPNGAKMGTYLRTCEYFNEKR